MYSIGDMIDKLVIENIKIFSLRDKLNSGGLSDKEHVELNNKMMILNENRGIIVNKKLTDCLNPLRPMEPKFSDLVGDLSLTWWRWMQNDNVCRDEVIPYSERREAAEECERLIRTEYEIIEKMDKFYE